MQIYLLRHGETEYNKVGLTQDVNNDIDITQEAKLEIDQARDEINEMLDCNHCDVALCSTMLRAKRTLQRLLFKRNCPILDVHYTQDLDEVNFGVFGSEHDKTFKDSAGKTMQDYRLEIIEQLDKYKLSKNYNCDILPTVTYEGGESIADIQKRCKSIVYKLEQLAKEGHEACLIVGHNRLFRHLLVELNTWHPKHMFDAKLPHAKLYFAGDISSKQ